MAERNEPIRALAEAALQARLRRRLVARFALLGAGAGILAWGGFVVAGGLRTGLAVAVIALAAGIAAGLLVARRRISRPALAAHLNRRFPELEESSDLLMGDGAALDPVRRLQRARVAPHATTVMAEPGRWLPSLRPGLPLALAVAGALLALGAPFLKSGMERAVAPGPGPASRAAAGAAPRLLAADISPPDYTGLPATRSETFDLELPEGARVRWTFAWPGHSDALQLVIGDGTDGETVLPLERAGSDRLVAEHTAYRTALYRLERVAGGQATPLPGVHTLTVRLDTPPRLDIVAPERTTVEVPPAGPTGVAYTVLAEDDYGLGPVEIRASVASGSGEGVKFRDEVFAFETSERNGNGRRLERTWSLTALGMEPGDEVYFFTVARDNRTPRPNEARSDTVVVRWLDDEPPPEPADGLAIDVMPAYFRSQRQIIIETEQLIADRDRLDPETFEATSRELGLAQSDLKERYGQYLGDEFEEGGAPIPTDTLGGLGERDPDDVHGDDHEAEAERAAEPGHDHGGGNPGPDTSGSAEALVRRFAHDHGAAEIGPITRRNPVGLMKRSVANMWQAELHLRLAQPEEALPYEYEALQYLNLARQADRIYTQRLGFEPPPVTEERRLTGELDEVESRVRRQEASPDPDTADLARELFAFLGATPAGRALADDERALLRRASRTFARLSQDRPALIAQAATLERLALEGRLVSPGCPDCLDTLRQAAWSLLPPAEPGPVAGERQASDPLAREWLETLGSFNHPEADR